MLKHRLLIASAMAALAMSEASAAAPAQRDTPKPRRKSVFKPARWPNEPDKRTQQQREIAEWNAAVDKRRADKRRLRGA